MGAGLAIGVAIGLLLGLNGRPAQAKRQAANPAHGSGQAVAQGHHAKLSAPHEALAKLVGKYERVVKFVGQTGAAAKPSAGTSTFTAVLGGRFILEKSNDVVFGRPVEGLRIYGYNDLTKHYEMVRMYTMSTGITMMEGTSSDDGKTIAYGGHTYSPGMGGMRLYARLHWNGVNQFTVTMSTKGKNGKQMPFQETIYTQEK